MPWAWHFINLGIPLLVPYTQTSFGALSHSSSSTLWLLCWHCEGKGALWGSPIKNIRVCNTLRIHLLHFTRLKGIQQVKITYIEDITWPLVLLVLSNISWASAAIECNIFQHEKRNFVSPSDHVMFYLLYKHQWMPNHFTSHSNGNLFTCENNMLFSRVKISRFRVKAHPVFSLVFMQ